MGSAAPTLGMAVPLCKVFFRSGLISTAFESERTVVSQTLKRHHQCRFRRLGLGVVPWEWRVGTAGRLCRRRRWRRLTTDLWLDLDTPVKRRPDFLICFHRSVFNRIVGSFAFLFFFLQPYTLSICLIWYLMLVNFTCNLVLLFNHCSHVT